VIKCPHCDHEQESGKFCDSCGLVIPKFQKPEAGVVLGHLVKGRTADSGERLCI